LRLEGGDGEGRIVATGTLEEVIEAKNSYTLILYALKFSVDFF